MIVLDASAAVELLLGGRRAAPVLVRIEPEEGAVHAPGLIDLEVAQVLRRLVRAGVMAAARGGASLEILADLPVTRHPATPLLPRIWSLREHLTAYDAAYVALAEALGCPLVTFDAALAAAPGVRARVEVLAK